VTERVREVIDRLISQSLYCYGYARLLILINWTFLSSVNIKSVAFLQFMLIAQYSVVYKNSVETVYIRVTVS